MVENCETCGRFLATVRYYVEGEYEYDWYCTRCLAVKVGAADMKRLRLKIPEAAKRKTLQNSISSINTATWRKAASRIGAERLT